MTQLSENSFAIEVPEDASDIDMDDGALYYRSHIPGFPNPIGRAKMLPNLPPGEYEIVCQDSKRITEEEAFKIVEHHLAPFDNTIIGFEDYTDVGYTSCETAQESFTTLLQSKHLNPSIRYVIILKTK